MHHSVTCAFRKTAAHFQYEFTLRHVGSVVQGLLTSQRDRCVDPPQRRLVVIELPSRAHPHGPTTAEQ